MKKKLRVKKIIISLIVLYCLFNFVNQMIDRVRIKSEIVTEQKELNIEKEKNQQLQDEVNMSKTDDYMVKLARERLGLVKENETPVIHSTDKK